MIRKNSMIIIAILVSAMIPLTAFTALNNLSAAEKKSEITAVTTQTENKIKPSEFSTAASGGQTNQDEPVLVKVTLVILVIWTGISFFLIHIERKLKKIETGLKG